MRATIAVSLAARSSLHYRSNILHGQTMSLSAESLAEDNSRLIAIGMMCGAVFTFSLLDSASKYLVTIAAVPILQAVWVRFLSHLAFSFVAFGPRSFGNSLKSARPSLQLLRSFLLMTTTGLNFLALQYLQLDQVATIFFLTPFLVAVLAGPILGEWIGWRRLVAILIGFSGVILIMRPGFGGIHWAVSYSFCATICYAVYTILTRYLARHDSSMVTQIYSPLAGLVILTPLGLWAWEWPAELSTWLLMLSTGVFGGFGHYLLILAHRRAPAPILAPFTYVGLMSQTLMGYLVFSQLPSQWTLAGGAVIVSSGLYLLYRERATSKEGPAAASLAADIRN
jgi:drug/metabolite transporter (DMT)-like permease